MPPDNGDLASDLMLREEGGVRESLLGGVFFCLGGDLVSDSELVTIGLP